MSQRRLGTFLGSWLLVILGCHGQGNPQTFKVKETTGEDDGRGNQRNLKVAEKGHWKVSIWTEGLDYRPYRSIDYHILVTRKDKNETPPKVMILIRSRQIATGADKREKKATPVFREAKDGWHAVVINALNSDNYKDSNSVVLTRGEHNIEVSVTIEGGPTFSFPENRIKIAVP